jgi:hypothetical protein
MIRRLEVGSKITITPDEYIRFLSNQNKTWTATILTTKKHSVSQSEGWKTPVLRVEPAQSGDIRVREISKILLEGEFLSSDPSYSVKELLNFLGYKEEN